MLARSLFPVRSLPLAAFALLTPALLSAQTLAKDEDNLVPNGSFEEVEGKLKRLGSIEMAKGWKSGTGVPADLYSGTVYDAAASAPRNAYGDQSALTGENYAGLVWWSYQGKKPRSYLSTKFKSPLKKDQRYCVRYYVSLGDLSRFATNELGAYIARNPANRTDEVSLTYKPQVPVLRSQVYDDMYSWQGVCGVYQATGGETHLIIGNFAANERTDNRRVEAPKGESRPQQTLAYYYIDDVSVFPVKSDAECTCVQIDEAESEFIFSRRGTRSPNMKPAERAEATVFYFKRFQRNIDRAMAPWIEELATLMNEDQSIRIRLVGHIDETEKERTRMRPDLERLAQERADMVKEALVQAGISASRITTAAKGATERADESGTEVGMSKNRRVEVELVK